MAKPEWLRVRARSTREFDEVEDMLRRLSLHTVCSEANCPNRMECFSRRTATFMILGSVCTRNCTFCNVQKGASPETVDPAEPLHVAQAAAELGLRHVVVTSVTRDDLPDGGAGHFADVVRAIRAHNPQTAVEVLIPDFKGDISALQKVVEAAPEIINHNVETVPRLYPEVRPMAAYGRSIELLRNVKRMEAGIYTKSGIMLGLGESRDEVLEVFHDLRDADCDFLTVGQYLAPSAQHHPVVDYIHPDTFKEYEETALSLGFKYVASGPLVRSSYQAEKALQP
jgi:lipoic acid synthetase